MDNSTLEEIVNFASAKLNGKYGFCGVANGPESAMLNSDDNEGNDIIITIKLKKDD